MKFIEMALNRKIGVASLIWGVSILLSRVVGIVREAVIGRTIGSEGDADVYWAAFVLPDFLNYLLAGGALSLVFIPIFSRYLSEGSEEEGWNAFGVISSFLLLALSGIVVLGWFYAPELVDLIAPGFNGEQKTDLVRLTRIVLPAQIFHFQGGLLAATLQAKDRHVLPALAPLVYTASIVGVGLLFWDSQGADAFAWGVLVGSILGPFGLPLIGNLRAGMQWRPSLNLKNKDFRSYIWLSLPVMLGFSVVVVDDWMFKRFGSLQEGVVSQLQYAKTLMKVPMGVFGLATGVAAFPTLSRLMAKGKTVEAYDTLVRACRLMLILAFAAQAALTCAGEQVATVIYGTDRFSPETLHAIGLYTGILCLALGAWSAQTVIARGFYAMQNTWTPTIVGTVIMVLAYPIYAWAGKTHGGLGLACVSSTAISLYVIVLGVLLRRKIAGPNSPRISEIVFPMIAAVALGIGAGEGLEYLLPTMPVLLDGALVGLTAIGVCLGAAWLFRVREVAEVAAIVRRKLGSRSAA
jgi:putative peptidoglycan lipid II flippase